MRFLTMKPKGIVYSHCSFPYCAYAPTKEVSMLLKSERYVLQVRFLFVTFLEQNYTCMYVLYRICSGSRFLIKLMIYTVRSLIREIIAEKVYYLPALNLKDEHAGWRNGNLDIF